MDKFIVVRQEFEDLDFVTHVDVTNIKTGYMGEYSEPTNNNDN